VAFKAGNERTSLRIGTEPTQVFRSLENSMDLLISFPYSPKPGRASSLFQKIRESKEEALRSSSAKAERRG
jgi:hypothetical protein